MNLAGWHVGFVRSGISNSVNDLEFSFLPE